MQKTTLTAVHALEFPRATHAKDYRPALPAMPDQTDSLLQGFVLGPAWYDLAKKIARNHKLPTLIYGETGTGKEQFAKLIHRLRGQEQRPVPFAVVNCANLSGDMALSSLFGHKKGAFTGAVQDNSGFIAEADGGILFLDEVHTLEKSCQQKLLRVLNDGTFRQVGGSLDCHSEFQLIGASTRDLEEAVNDGTFLLDLWMRMTGFEVKLPPLRERLDELPALIQSFLNQEHQCIPEPEFSRLVAHCQKFYWQGNVRQLFRTLKLFLALNDNDGSQIKAEQLPFHRSMQEPHTRTDRMECSRPSMERSISEHIMAPMHRDIALDEAMDAYEKFVIEACLNRHESVNGAMRALGVSRSALAVKRQKHGLMG